MQRRPFVLHLCRRDHPPCHAEAVLARAGWAVLPAMNLAQAIALLPHADVVVISSCWAFEEKHDLITAVKQRSSVPLICVQEASHQCGSCSEVNCLDPAGLVDAIRRTLQTARRPAYAANCTSANSANPRCA